MDVYLARIGADGAHKRAMETQHWLRLVQQVQTWHEETMAEALADIGIGAGSQSASSSDTKEAVKLTDREVTTRKTIRLLVEQSTKAYGAIWSTLPDELRSQASKGWSRSSSPPRWTASETCWRNGSRCSRERTSRSTRTVRG
jgi:hypothetical protein